MDAIRDARGAGDLRACAAVFAELDDGRGRSNMPRDEIKAAVLSVYMDDPGRRLRKTEITMRVRRTAFEMHADERTVYRWLGIARRMWADYRDKTCQ
ncbi:MAG: hypothetical protein IKQ87_00920 [Clostridia bacterium]|nr:hypothetical protein [Clostridia bacterium]